MKVPLYIAILHDISKFRISEFIPYAHYYYNNNGSPASVLDKHGEEDSTKEAESVRLAWLYHTHSNKHHWNYWATIKSDGTNYLTPIPEIYIKEMIADWIGASRAYNPNLSVFTWYSDNKNSLLLHENSRKEIENILKLLEENEDY